MGYRCIVDVRIRDDAVRRAGYVCGWQPSRFSTESVRGRPIYCRRFCWLDQNRLSDDRPSKRNFASSTTKRVARLEGRSEIEPHNLRTPGRLGRLPTSKDQALAVALRGNPTIQAAQSDRDAAKHAFDATAGAFLPSLHFEGRSLWGRNTATTFGDRTDMGANLVATWDIFRGGQDTWRRVEQSERWQEQSMRHARLQRGAFEPDFPDDPRPDVSIRTGMGLLARPMRGSGGCQPSGQPER